jgi:xylulokinase
VRKLVLAADLGTSGCKTALIDVSGSRLADDYASYRTWFPAPLHHEQRPADWWSAVRRSVRQVLRRVDASPNEILAIALSGQSLSLVPLDARDEPLLASVPIWSDARAHRQAARFFRRMPQATWYQRTGNGFPPELYTLFKSLWLRDEQPELDRRTRTIVGSKDYINLLLTGRIATDFSYASGSGAYDLARRRYDDEILHTAGVEASRWPEIAPSTAVVGTLRAGVAQLLGLATGTPVLAGGVDNACMALGAREWTAGRIYGSLGSSDWITVSTARPVLDPVHRPYVFDHVVPGLYVSAESTFGGGASVAWTAEQLGGRGSGTRNLDRLDRLASSSVPGAHGLLFVPLLAGGTVAEGGPQVRGAIVGLDLRHDRSDIARAALEGASLALRAAATRMRRHVPDASELLLVGGGSRSEVRRQILADVLRMPVVTTDVNQHAATLGAAAVALSGIGAWSDFAPIDAAHAPVSRNEPDTQATAVYDRVFETYEAALSQQASLARGLAALRDLGAATPESRSD